MNSNMKDFNKFLRELAKVLGIKPAEVTARDFKAGSDFPEWTLRKLGGFTAAKNFLFPAATVGGPEAQGTLMKAAWLKKGIKKQVVDDFLKLEFLEVVKEVLKETSIKVHPAHKSKKSNKRKSRTIVAEISDTHFGANIEATEMNNINAFNWVVAARRMALLAEQIVSYKPQHREDTKLVLAINGDIIAGMIHDQEWFADLLAKQTAGTLKIFIQFISYVAQFFDEVEVYCTSGNHGRSMHKSNKSRATTHKWDSYETSIYLGLKYAIEAKCPNVKCTIPETPYAIVEIQGHKFFVTHGDTVIDVGNPGRSINMKSINTQINSLNASALAGVKFAGVMVGHVHVPTVQVTDNGTVLLVNGALSGADPFCQGIGIFGNEPTQLIFEVTRDHAVGDMRFVRLRDADNRPDLEKIIEPLKGNLE